MRRILLIALLGMILVSPICFAEEVVTDCGSMVLTNNQVLNYTPQGIWKRFSYVNSEVFGVSDKQPSPGDITGLRSELASLPDVTPQSVYISNFDAVKFQGDLMNLLPIISNINLRLEFGAINTFAQNKDFNGMSQYLGFLLQNGIANQGDVDAVKGCVTSQGVIIG